MKHEHAGEWVASHDPKSMESWELIGPIRRYDRAILDPLKEVNGSWFCQQKVYNKIHETFREAIQHHSGSWGNLCMLTDFVCNVFIKNSDIGKSQVIQIPR
jgi:hypothetical protein